MKDDMGPIPPDQLNQGMVQIKTVATGLVGTASSIMALVASFATNLELWLRIIALLLGIAVSAVSLRKLLKP